MSDLKIQGEVTLDTTKAEGAFARIVSSAEKMGDEVKRESEKTRGQFDQMIPPTLPADVDRRTKSIISSIQRVIAKTEAGERSSSKYFEALAQQRGVNVDVLRPYLAHLDAAKAKQDLASKSLGSMEMSAKQTTAALRNVPAQFTDIAVSLQGGQNPLTVLLQQGGQLKDMFGGVGAAARALGGYVASLVTPFSLAGGALAAFAVAAYQGSKEFEAFNRQIIMNGGTAGVTADQLMSMAAGIDAVNENISQSKAAASIDEIVKAGVRGESQIKRFAIAAAEFERAGGGAASEVAKNFAELAKEPLQASMKLTQAMGYLTESTYAQIKSLQDQGRTLEAATLAQNEYASALENRTPALLENLGTIQRAWNGIKGAAAGAWDAMLNVGRADTLAEQIATLERRQAQSLANPIVGGGFAAAQGRARRDEEAAILAALKEQQQLASRSATATAERAQREKDRIGFLAQGDKYLSSEQKQQREILAVQQLRIKGIITEREEEQRIAAIRAQSAKSPARASRTKEKDEFGDLYNRITMKDTGLDPNFYKELDILYQGYLKGRVGVDEYRAAVEALIGTQRFATDAMKAQSAALLAAAASNNAAFDAEFEAIEKKRLSNEAQIKTGREMLEQIQFETSLLGMNAVQREEAIAMRELERQGIVAGTQAYEAYAEAMKKGMADRRAQEQTIAFWRELDSTAENVFMDIAMNGEDAFKRIGESIKREVIQMLYEMTVKKWIFQISGVSTGGGGTDWIGMATKAYDYYTGGATGAAASTYGSYAAAGGSYAAGAVGDAAVVSYGSSAASGSAASGASAIYGYMGYAALIAAAVMVAENLYSKGWNRAALGKGPGVREQVGNTTFQSDPAYSNSTIYNNSVENLNRKFLDALGVSEKWADILSGSVRMANTFGRKLSAYGFQADIADGEAEVSGFARYKGTLRGNKTVATEIDPRDAAMFDAMVESTVEGSKAMARALGYSDEAINAYTGSLKVNFKGAKTAEEQAERVAKAMDDLNFELLKTASGGKFAREEFKEFMAGIQKDIEGAGISTDGITDILTNGMLNGLSGEEIGVQLSQNIIGGVYAQLAQNTFAPVAAALMQQIITPMFTAIAAGIPLSQALNKAAMDNIVKMANDAASILNEIFNNEEFRAAMQNLGAAFGSIGGSVAGINMPKLPKIAAPKPVNTAADTAKREREQLEMELLQLQGNTTEIRRRERAALQSSNRALYDRVRALEDEQQVMEERKDLERQLLELRGDTLAIQALEREALNEANRGLYDQIVDLQRINELKDAWKGLTDSIAEEVKRLRGEMLGDTPAGLAYAQAQFTIATAGARAMDQAAAQRLPELAGQLNELYQSSANSRSEYEFNLAAMLASLDETTRITSEAAGLNDTSQVEDKELGKKIALLQQTVESLQRTMEQNTAAAQVTSDALKRASIGGALRTVAG
jgi:phage-related minor tail protein